MLFTVIGMYDDTHQVFTEEVEAEDAHEAFAAIASIHIDSELVLVIAVEGDCRTHCPTPDSGTACFGVDYPKET